jgi:hypothetical protein
MKRTVLAALTILLASVVVHAAGEKNSSPAFLPLDWKAPNRWVHVDNVDAKKAALFESCRKSWLQALHRNGEVLGDGRALFWQAHTSSTRETYFTFYPFQSWPDLDARAQMIEQNQKTLGDDAVKAYDAGDAALVSPHYSQFWRRVADYDIVADTTKTVTELTATAGRLEVHTFDITRSDDFDAAWKSLKNALVAARYPLVCRVFRSTYGKGEYMLWWMADDASVYKSAASWQSVLRQRLGKKESEKVFGTLKNVFPLEESYEVERRADLSNLGK